MGTPIKQISIEGFKSIRKLENFELRNLNVLIGANGAGKSNFVELFRMLRAMAEGNLQTYIAKSGGGDGLFFGGPKQTSRILIEVGFGANRYKFNLEPTPSERIVITNESTGVIWPGNVTFVSKQASGQESVISLFREPMLSDHFGKGIDRDLYESLSQLTVYHFHDTGGLSPLRREHSFEDTAYLRPDAANIAAFLFDLRERNTREYILIRDTVRLVAPFFDDFILNKRVRGNETKVTLDWRQKGSDFPFQAWHLSDGTIRFICLATALLQPNPPATVVIDEPELGLHPHALEVLAGLVQKTAQRVQVIISTQSAPLLSQFEPEDVITVSRHEGGSTFHRLDRESLGDWLKDYTLGELWQKNVVEAGAGDD